LAALAFLPACVLVVGAPRQRLQQLARVLEVAAPQHGRAFAGQAVGLVGVVRSSAMTTRLGGGMPLPSASGPSAGAVFLQWICGWTVGEEVSDMDFNR
jgi:hypothetical protein